MSNAFVDGDDSSANLGRPSNPDNASRVQGTRGLWGPPYEGEKPEQVHEKSLREEEESESSQSLNPINGLFHAGYPLVIPRRGSSALRDLEWVTEIAMFVPMYLVGRGNASTVELSNGHRFYYLRPSALTARDVLRYYAVDVVEMRKWFFQATLRMQSLPIVVPSRDLVLAPLKMRSPKVKNDGCMGYIADKFIADVERVVENHTYSGLLITLTTGSEVMVQMSLQNFTDQMVAAKYFKYYLKETKVHSW